MQERHDEFVQENQCVVEPLADTTLSTHKRSLNDWLRRTFTVTRNRGGLITMTPDGRITRTERIES